MSSETDYIKSDDIRTKMYNKEKLTKAELNSLAFAGYKLIEEHPSHPSKENLFWEEYKPYVRKESAEEEIRLNSEYNYLSKMKTFAWMFSSVSLSVPLFSSVAANQDLVNLSVYAAPLTISAAALTTAYVSNYFAKNKIIKNPDMRKTGGGFRDIDDPPQKFPRTTEAAMFCMQHKMQKIHDKLKYGFGPTKRRMVKKMLKKNRQKARIILNYKKDIESRPDDGYPTDHGFRTEEEGFFPYEEKYKGEDPTGQLPFSKDTRSQTRDEDKMDTRSDEEKRKDQRRENKKAIAEAEWSRMVFWKKVRRQRKEKEALENAKKNEKRFDLLGKINKMKKNIGIGKSENNYANSKP